MDAGRGDHPALIYDSPMTDSQRTYSFREARDAVAALAGVLRARGVEHDSGVSESGNWQLAAAAL